MKVLSTRSLPHLTAGLLLMAHWMMLPPAALGAAPQLTVEAAHYAFNAHNPNWTCDSQSELPSGTSCYSDYPPASYTFAHHGHVVEDPTQGKYVWLMDGGARDGGFANKVGDNLLTFESLHPQAPGKIFRKDSLEEPSTAGLHWEPFSAFWQSNAALSGSGSAYYWFVNYTDHGHLPSVTENRLRIGESANGTSSYTWHDAYWIERPSGQATGAMHLLNRDNFIPHPNDSTRWIGLVTWTRQTPTGNNDAGAMPVYIDTDDDVIGFQFASDGWCEYPLGHKFDTYNPAVTCSPTGNTSNTVPGGFYKITGLAKNVHSLANLDGVILVLYTLDSGRACSSSDVNCQLAHAPCPGTDPDKYPYTTPQDGTQMNDSRRDETEWDNGRTFYVRELDLSTWNESSTGHSWVGNAKQIQFAATGDQFDLAPTDIGSIFGHYDSDLKQFSDGTIYLYMGLKHSLCLPESGPSLNQWDRYPKMESGNSFVWFRLRSS